MSILLIVKKKEEDKRDLDGDFIKYLNKNFKTQEDMENRIYVHAMDFARMVGAKAIIGADGSIIIDATGLSESSDDKGLNIDSISDYLANASFEADDMRSDLLGMDVGLSKKQAEKLVMSWGATDPMKREELGNSSAKMNAWVIKCLSEVKNSNQLEEEDKKVLERSVNIELPIMDVLKELKLDKIYETNPGDFDFFGSITVDMVSSGQVRVPKKFDGIEDIFPETVARAAEEAQAAAMELAYQDAILEHAVDLLDAVDAKANYVGEDSVGNQVSVNVPFGMVSSVDKENGVFRVEITNPEHMWNAITDGIGYMAADHPVDKPLSEKNVKGLIGRVLEYFDVYGGKPKIDFYRIESAPISDDFYEELIENQISMLTMDDVVNAVLKSSEDGDMSDVVDAVEKFTKGEFKAVDVLKAAKAELVKRSKEIDGQVNKIKESSSIGESMKVGDRVRILMGDGAGEGTIIEPEEIPMKHTANGKIPDIVGTYNPTKKGLKAVRFDNGNFGLIDPENIELIEQPSSPNIKDQMNKAGE